MSVDPGRASDGPGPQEPDLGDLRAMWELLDPVPADLADRAAFALEEDLVAADLEVQLLRLQEETGAVGSRGDRVRTITFGGDALTVMIALSDVDGGYRVDAWVAPGGRRRVQVRTAAGDRDTACDDTGRSTVPLVPVGHLPLVLGRAGADPGGSDGDGGAPHGPTDGAPDSAPDPDDTAFVTPAVTL